MEHQWAANPFGLYCGVCGHQYVPDDAPPEFIEACRTLNGPDSDNEACRGR